MHRVSFLGDTHLLSPDIESGSLFPAHMGRLSPEAGALRYESHRRLMSDCHDAVVAEIERRGRPRLLVHLGDITGGWQERGLCHSSLLPLAQRAIDVYELLADAVGVCWSDHDTGYGGVRRTLDIESLRCCRAMSPLFWRHEVGGVLFLGVCSALLEKNSLLIPEASEIADEQSQFVADSLRAWDGGKWVLCSHNPILGPLGKVVAPYRATLERFVFGHRHVSWAGLLERSLGYVSPVGTLAAFRRKARLCPSAAPLFWRGGAFMSGRVVGGGLSLAVETVDYAEEVESVVRESPYASFAPSIGWTIAGVGRRFPDREG